MATDEELASVRDRLFGQVREDQIRQVTVDRPDPAVIAAEMDKITESREATQPIKSRTGGSTFKNPPGDKAWQLIDAAGCRGLRQGDAQVSEMHCNFLINLGGASAADIETLGETVRQRVKANSGVALEWEIKRIGVAAA